jgi:hypothetical protein
MTEQLLANIPRLEGVRAMLAAHINPPRRRLATDPATQLIELGAHLLRVAIDIEALGLDHDSSPLPALLARADLYDAEVLQAVDELYRDRGARVMVKSVPIRMLAAGMVLAEDVRFDTGNLLVARGYEITASFIERVKNLPPGIFSADFRIVVPC